MDQTLTDVHEVALLRDFVKTFLPNDNRYALREDTALLSCIPELLEDLDYFSPFSSRSRPCQDSYNSLWVGPAGYVTGLHVDPGDTILFQLFGNKQVLLFGPDETQYLYEENRGELFDKFEAAPLRLRISPVPYRVLRDGVRWSRARPFVDSGDDHPRLKLAQSLEARIGPGDALYIPDQWWHTVRSLDVAISVSMEPKFDGPLFRQL
jgi:lysine-specific demethylase 8